MIQKEEIRAAVICAVTIIFGVFPLPRDDKKEASYAFARKATATGLLILPRRANQ
jgi:hypothetical protein